MAKLESEIGTVLVIDHEMSLRIEQITNTIRQTFQALSPTLIQSLCLLSAFGSSLKQLNPRNPLFHHNGSDEIQSQLPDIENFLSRLRALYVEPSSAFDPAFDTVTNTIAQFNEPIIPSEAVTCLSTLSNLPVEVCCAIVGENLPSIHSLQAYFGQPQTSPPSLLSLLETIPLFVKIDSCDIEQMEQLLTPAHPNKHQ